VGLSRPRACLAHPAGEQDHRLVGVGQPRCGGDEGTPVGEVLEVDGDRTRALVARELVQEVRRHQIGLIPERRKAGKAETGGNGESGELQREISALRHEGHRARRQRAPAEVELLVRVEDTEAVGAEQDRAGRSHALRRGRLDPPSVRVVLAETGRDPHDRPRTGFERVVDRLLEPGRRNADRCELRRLRDVGDRRERRLAEDLAARAIHEKHRSPVTASKRASRDRVPPLRRVGRRADDGHRPRGEQRPQIAIHASRRREMIRRWMSDVPSSISSSFASRIHFSTGYSRE
jgi:hypothetical protein